jgi:glutathione synthase/RimK-type ligase-like ATP-grasp enzyme
MGEAGVSIPDYTTDRNLVSRDDIWLARTALRGSGGAGIIVCEPGDPIPDAPLYVKYIPKKYEVRIHVGNGRAFDWQQKMRARDADHSKIRSHDNGYTFVRNNTDIPIRALGMCQEQAEKAVGALGLDFGAVDVIFNERRDSAYVLEANTAPGLEGTTVTKYADMLRGLFNVGR